MKCSKCGKEIAEDSFFCEFCGTKLSLQKRNSDENTSKTDDSKVVKSFFVVLLMFFIIFYSTGVLNTIYIIRTYHFSSDEIYYFLNNSYRPAALSVFIVNLCMFVCSLVLSFKKKIRYSTTIALCATAAIIIVSSLCEYFGTHVGSCGSISHNSLTIKLFSYWVPGIYAVYLIIAKWKNIKF